MLIATSEHMAPLSLAQLRRWVHETDFSRHLADDLPVIERSAALRDGRFCSGKTGSKHDLEKNRSSHQSRPGQKESRPGQKASSDCGQVETGQRGGETPLPSADLDLSLPKGMVEELKPVGTVPLPRRDPVLPQMFGDKSSQFQLNGRLISNEMQLQRRNEERREVEGAALEFEFKH